MTDPIPREVIQPRISLSFKYLKYVLLEILVVFCSWTKEIGADCLMRFILIWSNVVVNIGRHYSKGQIMAVAKYYICVEKIVLNRDQSQSLKCWSLHILEIVEVAHG